MLLVFKWGLKWEQGRYLREQPGPRGEIQPQSLLYHYCKIGLRWRHGKYDSVCELMGTAQGECRPDDLCERARARWELVSVCVCALKLAAVVGWALFSPPPVYTGGEGVRTWYQRTGGSHALHNVILLNESLPSFLNYLILIVTISNCLSRFLLLEPHPFLVPVLGRQSGHKCLSSTSNFTTRPQHTDNTSPFRLIGSICIGHLLCILIDGFNQRIRGSAQTSISVRPLPFFRACDSLLGLIKESKFRQRERERERG